MSNQIKIEGLGKTLARLDIKRFEPEIQTRFDSFGLTVELKARQFAPVDEGHLKGSIFQQPGKLSNTVGASVDYAAYLEFGTRKYAAAQVATLPQDWQMLAAQYKGKGGGGTFKQFVLRLTEWVHRKGLGTGFAGKIGVAGTYSVKSRKRTGGKPLQESQDRQAAYAIALKILRNGIKAQPFLYPAFNIAKDQLLKELNEIKV